MPLGWVRSRTSLEGSFGLLSLAKDGGEYWKSILGDWESSLAVVFWIVGVGEEKNDKTFFLVFVFADVNTAFSAAPCSSESYGEPITRKWSNILVIFEFVVVVLSKLSEFSPNAPALLFKQVGVKDGFDSGGWSLSELLSSLSLITLTTNFSSSFSCSTSTTFVSSKLWFFSKSSMSALSTIFSWKIASYLFLQVLWDRKAATSRLSIAELAIKVPFATENWKSQKRKPRRSNFVPNLNKITTYE